MDVTESLRDDLPGPGDTMIDAEIWQKDSHELYDLAETLVNRHPRFAWLVVEAWCNKYSRQLIDQDYQDKG